MFNRGWGAGVPQQAFAKVCCGCKGSTVFMVSQAGWQGGMWLGLTHTSPRVSVPPGAHECRLPPYPLLDAATLLLSVVFDVPPQLASGCSGGTGGRLGSPGDGKALQIVGVHQQQARPPLRLIVCSVLIMMQLLALLGSLHLNACID